ncbi:Mannitol-1-phosphate 5-dehydrogenase [Acidipropionibacterium virtanenii]|uniref:Mannitol-1-phosphate 5-dehydrogenase n=2 Tax=Acidipropionibacterium virtanenii TaxID=2057246 RepID=A0A344UUX9_9ACTN|nr:Mannitol-1-phosphate 5-dehydrogenase [Acidipropionibacterium virtanenii]
MGMRAVHFGAGNIGRGFVGLLLAEAGYELTFADVADQLIEQLQGADSYEVHEVGDELRTHVVSGFSAINSAKDSETLTGAIAAADVVTTAVGVSILKFVAPGIAAGIAARPASAPPVAVMACENAIGATSILEAEIRSRYEGDDLDERAVFANTAVDRIVPAQDPGLDVTVENYFEWAIETGPFGDRRPEIPGVTWVPDLAPYIERKLFTVNTGHATTAYLGYARGVEKISDALNEGDIEDAVSAVLAETRSLLVAKYGFDRTELESYAAKIMRRFANPYLPDTVERVGRSPLRKLSRNDRFVGPASQLAERGLSADALLTAIGAALRFDYADDKEAVELQRLLADEPAEKVVETVTGLEPEHPLYPAVLDLVKSVQD